MWTALYSGDIRSEMTLMKRRLCGGQVLRGCGNAGCMLWNDKWKRPACSRTTWSRSLRAAWRWIHGKSIEIQLYTWFFEGTTSQKLTFDWLMIGFSMSFPLPYIQIEELRTNGTVTLNVKSLEVTSSIGPTLEIFVELSTTWTLVESNVQRQFGFNSMADSKWQQKVCGADLIKRFHVPWPSDGIYIDLHIMLSRFFILLDGLATGLKSASLYSRSLKISPGTSSSRSSFWTIWRRHTTDTVGVVWRAVVELIMTYFSNFEHIIYIYICIYIYIYTHYIMYILAD